MVAIDTTAAMVVVVDIGRACMPPRDGLSDSDNNCDGGEDRDDNFSNQGTLKLRWKRRGCMTLTGDAGFSPTSQR